MNRSISEKLGIKKGMRTFLLHAPDDFAEHIVMPEVELKSRLVGEFDYIHFFVTKEKELHTRFESLKKHLHRKGVLWLSWPKSGQNETDLNIQKVIEIGYSYGLVESKAISINSLWSALKFTHPIDGKAYNNSYGKLKK